MGYFNFYLLRQILKNKKIKKFLLFVIIFLIVLFIKNKCFASYVINIDGVDREFPDFPSNLNYSYKFIRRVGLTGSDARTFVYRASDSPFQFLTPTSSENRFRTSTANYTRVLTFNSTWTSYTWGSLGTESANTTIYLSKNNNPIIYSNEPLYYIDSSTGQPVYIYTPPESYDYLPHILNDAESLTIGGQSIVIMPRRFS